MRISDWSSDVCSSDLVRASRWACSRQAFRSSRSSATCSRNSLFSACKPGVSLPVMLGCKGCCTPFTGGQTRNSSTGSMRHSPLSDFSAETRPVLIAFMSVWRVTPTRSEEHTSELQSLMPIPYAVFRLKKKNTNSFILITYNCTSYTHIYDTQLHYTQ